MERQIHPFQHSAINSAWQVARQHENRVAMSAHKPVERFDKGVDGVERVEWVGVGADIRAVGADGLDLVNVNEGHLTSRCDFAQFSEKRQDVFLRPTAFARRQGVRIDAQEKGITAKSIGVLVLQTTGPSIGKPACARLVLPGHGSPKSKMARRRASAISSTTTREPSCTLT